jgi:hypothetical protein
VDNSEDLVVKYHVNCGDRIHPLMREYFFVELLEDLDVTPAASFLSPATHFDGQTPRTPKLAFRMNEEQYRLCGAQPNSAVRYMVMSAPRATMGGIVRWEGARGRNLPFDVVMRNIDAAISALRAIHNRGIVHGTVNGNTVVLLESGSVGFTDFSHAIHLQEFPFVSSSTAAGGEPMDCFDTAWTLLGHRPSFRDDLARLLMVAGFMLNGLPWLAHCQSLTERPLLMATYKLTGNWFALRNASDFLSGIPRETQRLIHQHLVNALNLSRAVVGLDAAPPYSAVQAELRAALTLVTAPLPPSPTPSKCCAACIIC